MDYVSTGYLQEVTDVVGITEKEKPIGILDYFKDNFGFERCHIQAMINRELFNALVSAIQSGRVPDRVSVNVRGLKYGWEPDGSGKIWDVKALGHAHVTNLAFGILLVASNTECSEDASSESIGHLPASSADIQALQSHITDQIALLTRTVWTALAYLLGAVLLLWIFRH